MKTLLLLGCAAWLSACGGSSSGTGPTGQQVQTMPSSTNQVPQQPADSVPPANSQQPPGNSQQAPTNSQQPTLGSTATPPAITCAQVAAALQTGGCHISASAMSDCVAGTAASMPCGAEYQALLTCLLHGVACNNATGTVNLADACPDQDNALGACLAGVAPLPACSANSNCNGCADTCALCQCTAASDPGLNLDCTPFCPVN
jgi:hypothetical protein